MGRLALRNVLRNKGLGSRARTPASPGAGLGLQRQWGGGGGARVWLPSVESALPEPGRVDFGTKRVLGAQAGAGAGAVPDPETGRSGGRGGVGVEGGAEPGPGDKGGERPGPGRGRARLDLWKESVRDRAGAGQEVGTRGVDEGWGRGWGCGVWRYLSWGLKWVLEAGPEPRERRAGSQTFCGAGDQEAWRAP